MSGVVVVSDQRLLVHCTRALLEGWHPEVLFEGGARAIVIGPATEAVELALQADTDTDAVLFADDPDAPDLSSYWKGNAWSILLLDPSHCLEEDDHTTAHVGEMTFDLSRADNRARATWVISGRPSGTQAFMRLHRRRPKGARTDRGSWLAFGEAGEWTYPGSRDRRFPSRAVVQGFAELDPDDPRLLLDGSRYVDALALAAILRELP